MTSCIILHLWAPSHFLYPTISRQQVAISLSQHCVPPSFHASSPYVPLLSGNLSGIPVLRHTHVIWVVIYSIILYCSIVSQVYCSLVGYIMIFDDLSVTRLASCRPWNGPCPWTDAFAFSFLRNLGPAIDFVGKNLEKLKPISQTMGVDRVDPAHFLQPLLGLF